MNLTDELQRLAGLHDAGSLTDAEFAAAKTHTLASAGETTTPAPETDDRLAHQVQRLDAEAAIARLDREWLLEREQYMVSGKHGSRYLPSEGGSVAADIVFVLFGIVWATATSSARAPEIFPAFGVLIGMAGIFVGIGNFGKATEYNAALARYKSRRTELLAQAGLPVNEEVMRSQTPPTAAELNVDDEW